MEVTPLLREPEFRALVESFLQIPISRPTLHRWRQEIGIETEFTPKYAPVLAVFGRCRRQRKSIRISRQITQAFAQENRL